jgi:hypothetical protein
MLYTYSNIYIYIYIYIYNIYIYIDRYIYIYKREREVIIARVPGSVLSSSDREISKQLNVTLESSKIVKLALTWVATTQSDAIK